MCSVRLGSHKQTLLLAPVLERAIQGLNRQHTKQTLRLVKCQIIKLELYGSRWIPKQRNSSLAPFLKTGDFSLPMQVTRKSFLLEPLPKSNLEWVFTPLSNASSPCSAVTQGVLTQFYRIELAPFLKHQEKSIRPTIKSVIFPLIDCIKPSKVKPYCMNFTVYQSNLDQIQWTNSETSNILLMFNSYFIRTCDWNNVFYYFFLSVLCWVSLGSHVSFPWKVAQNVEACAKFLSAFKALLFWRIRSDSFN